MVLLVCIEGIWVLYSSYIVGLIVLVFFSGYRMFLAVFSYSPGFVEGTLLILFTLFTLILTPYFASVYIGSANFSSVKLVYW